RPAPLLPEGLGHLDLDAQRRQPAQAVAQRRDDLGIRPLVGLGRLSIGGGLGVGLPRVGLPGVALFGAALLWVGLGIGGRRGCRLLAAPARAGLAERPAVGLAPALTPGAGALG